MKCLLEFADKISWLGVIFGVNKNNNSLYASRFA